MSSESIASRVKSQPRLSTIQTPMHFQTTLRALPFYILWNTFYDRRVEALKPWQRQALQTEIDRRLATSSILELLRSS